MASALLLVLGVGAAWATFVTLVRVRHPAFLSFPVMMTSWLTGEWPVFHLVAQATAAGLLVVAGGLDETRGVVGLALTAASILGLLRIQRVTLAAAPTAEAALRAGLGADYLERLGPAPRAQLRSTPDPQVARRPVFFDRSGLEIIRDIPYGDHPVRNLLDIYRPAELPENAPVIIQIHGGAWIIGHKQQQGQPLLHRLAANGYVGVSINYRLGPKSRFPDPIVDVKRAIAWVRTNISEHGGDPSRIILTGGSAGGHLAMLAALTPNRAEWQPGFEDIDTSVVACVPFYGPADFGDRYGIRGRTTSMKPFLERFVMPTRRDADPELWDAVSPVVHVGADAPPFFVIQGTHDVLVWREETADFVARLREASTHPVVYWEVPGAQHAFDTLNSIRSVAAVDAIERFVGWVAAPTPVGQDEQR